MYNEPMLYIVQCTMINIQCTQIYSIHNMRTFIFSLNPHVPNKDHSMNHRHVTLTWLCEVWGRMWGVVWCKKHAHTCQCDVCTYIVRRTSVSQDICILAIVTTYVHDTSIRPRSTLSTTYSGCIHLPYVNILSTI